MTQRRLFAPPDVALASLSAGEPVSLAEDEAHYARHVLRLADGAPLVLLDGSGLGAPGRLVHTGKRGATVTVLSAAAPQAPSCRPLTLVIPAAKGERTDWLVEKATEMGVRRLVVTQFERSVVDATSSDKRLARYLRLARAACRQAGHGALPQIEIAASLPVAMGPSNEGPGGRAVAHPRDAQAPLTTWLSQQAGPVSVVIGPEGGLCEAELQRLKDNAYTAVSLGPYILRTETAAMVAAAACLLTPAPGHNAPRL